MPNTQSRIFFSYSRSDSNFVLKVARALRSEGRSVWVDQLDIPTGARWDEEVEKALKASNCLLVVLSPASTSSQNVLDEVSYALEEKRKVLPILLQPTNIPFRLKRLQYIDFTADFDTAYKQLSTALDHLPAIGNMIQPLAEPQAAAIPVVPAAAPPVAAPPTAPVAAPVPAAAATQAFSAPPPASSDAASRPRSMAAIVMMLSLVLLLLLGGAYWLYAMRATPAADGPSARPAAVVEPPAQTEPAPQAQSTPQAALVQPGAVLLDSANRATPQAPTVSDQQLEAFVDDYIRAQNRSSAVALLEFYAERIDYFDRTGVDKEFVLKDKQSFYRRWPQTANRRTGDVQIERLPDQPAVNLTYPTEFRVHSPERSDSRSGQAQEHMRLRFDDGRIRIVAQWQEVVGSAAQGKKN